jgi:hypothetical protein
MEVIRVAGKFCPELPIGHLMQAAIKPGRSEPTTLDAPECLG